MNCEKHESDIRDLKKKVFGNGQRGLDDRMTIIEEKMTVYERDVNNINVNIEVLTRYMTRELTKAEIAEKDGNKKSVHNRWLIGLTISSVLTFLTMILNFVL